MEPGLRATVSQTVEAEHTAQRVGSGDTPVLATPIVLACVERAAVAALEGSLEPGQTSVGVRVELDHLAPTAPGARIDATATLDEVDGRRLRFSFSVADPGGEVALGRHDRVVVARGPFLETAESRMA